MTPEQEAAIRAELDHPDNRDPSCQNCWLHILIREVDALRADRDAWQARAEAAEAALAELMEPWKPGGPSLRESFERVRAILAAVSRPERSG